MFQSKVTFVVGAGASSEVGLPVGETLKAHIGRAMALVQQNEHHPLNFRDPRVQSAVLDIARELNGDLSLEPYIEATRHLNASLPYATSIDNLLDAHQGNSALEYCGKVGIVSSILAAERESKIYWNPETEQANPVSSTWYSEIFKMMSEGVSKGDVEFIFRNVTFISFNYDRCIEHYMYYALQTYYNLLPQDAAQIMSLLDIVYPYGSVGPHPWRERVGQIAQGIDFGSRNCPLAASASGIRTFCESVAEVDEIEGAKSAILNSRRLVFLGFAFHKQNLDLIIPNKGKFTNEIFATALGISSSDCETIKSGMRNWITSTDYHTAEMIDARIHLRNEMRCVDLFHEYRRTLTA